MANEAISDFEIVKRHLDGTAPDLLAILNDLGIAYRETSLENGASGAIEANNGRFTISVNRNDGPQRQRFTIAHEIGHYLLHRDLLEEQGKLHRHTDILFGKTSAENPPSPFWPKHEVQANQFAAALLMPKVSVEKRFEALKSKTDPVTELAREFNVSIKAMSIRLANLGLKPLDE